MAKTEVYSWRISPELKQLLASAAKDEGASMAEFLEKIVRAWFREHRDTEDERRQRELLEAAGKCFGGIAGGDPKRSRSARDALVTKLGSRRKSPRS
jgi:hypothetical protein